MADWQSSLQAFLDSNPDLPAGDDNRAPDESDVVSRPRLEIVYERKGRNGKPVTIIAGFGDMPDDEVADIARHIKTRIGTGGSARGGEILIQGDRRRQVRDMLVALGFKTNNV